MDEEHKLMMIMDDEHYTDVDVQYFHIIDVLRCRCLEGDDKLLQMKNNMVAEQEVGTTC